MQRRWVLAVVLVVFLGAVTVSFGIPGEKKHNTRDTFAQLKAAVASKSAMRSYVLSRRLSEEVAMGIARKNLAAMVKKDPENKGVSFSESREFRDLCAVAEDAWPFLRDEWKRCSTALTLANRKKMNIIGMCWGAIREERAIGLLAELAFKTKKTGAVSVVERISGKRHGMKAHMTGEELKQYMERFSKWWKGHYRAQWKYRMNVLSEREDYLKERAKKERAK